MSRGDLWRRIAWDRIHGDDWHEADVRGLDGDFVRSYRIAGDLTVRHNRILHAFNGVHCFNRRPDFPDSSEPERLYLRQLLRLYPRQPDRARGHRLELVGLPQPVLQLPQMVLARAGALGYFYIFGNLGWFDGIPVRRRARTRAAPCSSSARRPDRARAALRLQQQLVPTLRPRRLRALGRPRAHEQRRALLRAACLTYAPACTTERPAVRRYGERQRGRSLHERVGRAQDQLRNDCIAHHEFPRPVRAAGIRSREGLGRTRAFAIRQGDFRLDGESPCRGKARQLTLELLERPSVTVTPRDIGAFQDDG